MAMINIKTVYNTINTMKISAINVLVKKEIGEMCTYRNVAMKIADKINTFLFGRNCQVNVVIKESEIYINRN